jgi:SecD/SecF fusion protein
MSDYFDRIERQLVGRVEASPRHPAWISAGLGYLAPAAAVLVVIAVVAVYVGVGANRASRSPASHRSAEIVFAVVASNSHALSGPAIDASIGTLRRRIDAVFPGVRVARAGDRVVVQGASSSMRAGILELSTQGNFSFFDWEANALTPNGKTVASQLRAHDPRAIAISQGAGSAPGTPGAGGMSLYDAVKLASKQPPAAVTESLGRIGPQYYLFGAPGSAACAAAARANGTAAIAGEHCLLSGPDPSATALTAGLPAGVAASEGERVTAPQGTIVLQAANPSASDQIKVDSPRAQFYVLKDNASLGANEITKPHPGTDQSGNPDIAFGFTSAGARVFQRATSTIAHRGTLVSGLDQTLNQHFAVALDNQLITVPSIDFKQYPEGISGDGGADITGGFTSQSARVLSVLLRYPLLNVQLVAH